MSETKVSDPVFEGRHMVRKVRRNRKNYGEIRTYKDSKFPLTIYWTTRRLDQLHRMTKSWLFEANVISTVRLYGVTHVGIRVEDGSVYLTRIATFSQDAFEMGVQRRRSNTYVDPFGNKGAICWFVPVHLWALKEGTEEERHDHVMREVHVKRARVRKSAVTV